MPLIIGLGGGISRRSSSSSGEGGCNCGPAYITVGTIDELHSTGTLGNYILDGEIYSLVNIGPDTKTYIHYGEGGNITTYIYNSDGTSVELKFLSPEDVINSLDTEYIDKPLSAAQGKVLYDELQKLKNTSGGMSITEVTNLSEINSKGFYSLGDTIYFVHQVSTNSWDAIEYTKDGVFFTNYNKVIGFKSSNKEVTFDKVVNNLTTTQEGFVLDARAGKSLKDDIDSLRLNTQVSLQSINKSIDTLSQGTAETTKTLTELEKRIQVLEESGISQEAINALLAEVEKSYVKKEVGKGLSQEDFTTEYKRKLDALTNVVRLLGKKSSTDELPQSGNAIGDMWIIPEDTEYIEYVWVNSGTELKWEALGRISKTVNLDDYYTKQEVNNLIEQINSLSILTSDDIADDLITKDPSKVLSAKQGNLLSERVDAIKDEVTELNKAIEDWGYLTESTPME